MECDIIPENTMDLEPFFSGNTGAAKGVGMVYVGASAGDARASRTSTRESQLIVLNSSCTPLKKATASDFHDVATYAGGDVDVHSTPGAEMRFLPSESQTASHHLPFTLMQPGSAVGRGVMDVHSTRGFKRCG